MDFRSIIGHENIITHLKSAITKQTISHAYLLEGEDGSGKLMLAEAFAKDLLCEDNIIVDGKKVCCNHCKACLQVETKNHPDVVYVTHEKASIGVEDIRVQLNSDIAIKPYSSDKKVYIIDEAEKMTEGAQNALLKTIEEPPEYAVILLLTNNRNAMLQTILSRCVRLTLWPVPSEKIVNFLMEQYQIPDYLAKISSAFSGGIVGKAIQFATSDEFDTIKSYVIQLVNTISECRTYELMEMVKVLNEDKGKLTSYLDLCILWYRDVLIYKSTLQSKAVMFQEDISNIKRQAERFDYDKIELIFRAIDEAKQRLKANVNAEIVIEMMLLTIKENRND